MSTSTRKSPRSSHSLRVSFPKPLTVEDVLSGDVIELPDGSYMMHCPSHGDSTPSLHVSRKKDGSALLYCFAGCEYSEIVRCLDDPHEAPPKISKGDPLDGFEVVANYGYRDKDNKLLYTITRYENGDRKTFRRA